MSRIKRGCVRFGNRLPLVGKIKIGEKRTGNNGKEYPTSLDYFKATGKYEQYFNRQFPEKTNKLTIIFIDDDPDYSCNERFEGRDKSGKLIGKGDGENWYLYNDQTDRYEPVDNEILRSATVQNGWVWSETLTLRFIVPELKGLLGVWEFSTKGKKSSIEHIRNTYDTIKEQAGTVVNLPFDLVVEKVKSQKPGNTRVFPVVNLIPHISHDNMLKIRQFTEVNENGLLAVGMLTDEKINTLKIVNKND